MPPPRKTFSPDQITDIISSYSKGESIRRISKRLATDSTLISRILKEAQILIVRHRPKTVHRSHIEDIISSYQSGESLNSIAERLGWDKGRVVRTLIRANIPIRVFRIPIDTTNSGKKICKSCGHSKSIAEFAVSRKGSMGVSSNCLLCISKHAKKKRISDPIGTMLKAAKARAEKKHIKFDITPDDVSIPDICPLLGIPIIRGEGKASINSPSLDRIIPSLGYVRGNVWVISNRANTIKQDATIAEIELLARSLRCALDERNSHYYNNREAQL